MENNRPLLTKPAHVPNTSSTHPSDDPVVGTRDHELIRRWAHRHQAEPATGEQTDSGPATVNVNDGGAGVRFNFPGVHVFRPISWQEWFENFDRYGLTFVFEQDKDETSRRYRIVNAAEWGGQVE